MPLAVPSRRPAATSTRVAAALIDVVCLLIISVMTAAMFFLTGVSVWSPLSSVIIGLFGAAYEVGLTTWRGQTIGKRAVKIVVVCDNDLPPSLARSLVRFLAKTLQPLGWVRGVEVALIVLLYQLALLASIGTHQYRRGWHDRIAGTWVMEEQGRRSMTEKLGERVPQVPIIER